MVWVCGMGMFSLGGMVWICCMGMLSLGAVDGYVV